MNNKARNLQYFFYSQYFSDGIRITLGILLPSLIFSQLGQFETGLTLSLGALCVSIADTPGPVVHKRNGMFYCCLFMFAVALITGYARPNMYTMGLEVLLLSFFFSMFAVYGNRAAAVGTAVLLVMILMMEKRLAPAEVPGYSALILGGGLWYMALSLVFFQIRPYRQAQQALGECIHEVAVFLRLRAAFYTAETDQEQDYQRLVAQQGVVSEKQDAVRELLFKSRQLVKESSATSRMLLLTFVDVVDLYEQIMATHYDYPEIREKFGPTGVLPHIAHLIMQTAEELDNVGVAIQANSQFRKGADLQAELEQLKLRIDKAGEQPSGASSLVLKKILINMRNLVQRLNNVVFYCSEVPEARTAPVAGLEYGRFVSHQSFELGKFRDNLTFSSSVFKHALRVALACIFGFIITKLIAYGHHSYWVLLTIIVILKPGFSLTKQRNYQRLVGTLVGGTLGILILVFLPDRTVQFVLLLFLMVGTYSFLRTNYIVSVIFMTPYILILFSFLGVGQVDLAKERIIDTLIGSAIAFAGSYAVLPSWESESIKGFMQDVLRANMRYLQQLVDSLSGKNIDVMEYKLARKEVYVSAANLSAAFQRMLSEPKNKQRNSKEIHKFVVLNHILSSNIATLTSTIADEEPYLLNSPHNLKPVKRALGVLHESLRKLGASTAVPEPAAAPSATAQGAVLPAPDPVLKDQLDFILKLSNDICRVTDAVAGTSA